MPQRHEDVAAEVEEHLHVPLVPAERKSVEEALGEVVAVRAHVRREHARERPPGDDLVVGHAALVRVELDVVAHARAREDRQAEDVARVVGGRRRRHVVRREDGDGLAARGHERAHRGRPRLESDRADDVLEAEPRLRPEVFMTAMASRATNSGSNWCASVVTLVVVGTRRRCRRAVPRRISDWRRGDACAGAGAV